MNSKKCLCCGEVKTFNEYRLNNAKKDKKENICSACHAKKRLKKGIKPRVIDSSPEGFKTCIKCGKVKAVGIFGARKSYCRPCRLESNKEYSLKNKESLLAKRIQYKKDNEKNIALYKKNYRIRNKDHISTYNKKYNLENKEILKEKAIIYEKNNKDILTKKRAGASKKRNSTRQGKLRNSIRCLLWQNLKENGYKKTSRTHEYVGCSYKELIEHLNKDKYNMDNLMDNTPSNTLFHLDHIIPTSYFMKKLSDKTEKEIKSKWYNYRNLRVLPATENMIKSDKLDMDLIREYGIEDLLMD